MTTTFIPNFTYDEETELLAAVACSIAYMRQCADESVENKDYWMRRAQKYHELSEKLNKEVRNFYYNK